MMNDEWILQEAYKMLLEEPMLQVSPGWWMAPLSLTIYID